MVGGCGILLERGVVGGDGMIDWEETLYGGRNTWSMYVCMETCNI